MTCGLTLPQIRRHAFDDAAPVIGFLLPEQADGFVPRRIVAVQQPAPVGGVGQHERGGRADGAGDVGDRGVDADQALDVAQNRHCVREVGDVGAEVDDGGFAPIAADLGDLVALLHGHHRDVPALQQGRKGA